MRGVNLARRVVRRLILGGDMPTSTDARAAWGWAGIIWAAGRCELRPRRRWSEGGTFGPSCSPQERMTTGPCSAIVASERSREEQPRMSSRADFFTLVITTDGAGARMHDGVLSYFDGSAHPSARAARHSCLLLLPAVARGLGSQAMGDMCGEGECHSHH